MKILFTICGRAGSKGIKNKNISDFLGKSLPLYTLSTIDLYLQRHPEVACDIVLNTDSPELVQIFADSALRDVISIPRKEELAGDKVGKVEVIRDCLAEMTARGNAYDMVVDLDITSPLRKEQDLANLIDEMAKGNPEGIPYDVVFTVAPSRRNPYFNMVMKNEDGFYDKVIASDFTARQQAPEIFDMNASIYAYAPAFLEKGLTIFEGKCGVTMMTDTGILDLDHKGDMEIMEVIAGYLFDNYSEFAEVRDNIK